MTTIRKSWIGAMLLAGVTGAAVAHWARPVGYTAVRVPELPLCRKFTTELKQDPGDFLLVDCKTGREVGAAYVVDGNAYWPTHVSWSTYQVPGAFTWVDSTAHVQLTGDVTASRPSRRKHKRRNVWPDDQPADLAREDQSQAARTTEPRP